MVEIAPGVHRLQFAFVNAFLVDSGSELVLIDAGTPGSGRQILAYLQKLGRSPSELQSIAITHCHFDHVGGLPAVVRATGAKVCAGEADAAVIRGEAPQVQPPLNRPLRIAGRVLGAIVRPAYAAVDRILKDGDRVGPLVTLASPGHTPGHLCFYWPERRTLFAGDSMRAQPRLTGPAEAFTMDMHQAEQTLRRLSKFDIDTICVAHGKPILAGAGDQLRGLVEGMR